MVVELLYCRRLRCRLRLAWLERRSTECRGCTRTSWRRSHCSPRAPLAFARFCALETLDSLASKCQCLSSQRRDSLAAGRQACGHVMVLRQNRSHFGRFWGCSMYPRCRATQPGPEQTTHFNMGYGSEPSTRFPDNTVDDMMSCSAEEAARVQQDHDRRLE